MLVPVKDTEDDTERSDHPSSNVREHKGCKGRHREKGAEEEHMAAEEADSNNARRSNMRIYRWFRIRFKILV